MPYDAILTTLAEIGITVVGFSLLASVFRGAGNRLRFLTFRNVAEIGLICAYGALAPQLFQSLGVSEVASWRSGSGTFGLLLLLGNVFGIRRMQDLPKPKPSGLIVAGWICVPIVYFLVGANLFFPAEVSGGRHVLAIILLLSIGAMLFLIAAFDMDLGEPIRTSSDRTGSAGTEDETGN
jgi:hypothetical protein